MVLSRSVLGGGGGAEGVELGPEAPPVGTTAAGWPGAPSWTSSDSSFDGSRGVVELDLVLSACELVETERR